MGERIIDLLEKILTGPKRRFFGALIIIALALGIIVFPYIDANFLYYNRIEKRIDNLQTMVELTGGSLKENESLYAEFNSILEEMDAAREKALSNATNKVDTLRDRHTKFLAGAGLWFAIALGILFSKKKEEKWSFKKVTSNLFSAIVCIGIGLGIGCFFTLIPTVGTPGISAALGIVLEVIVLWLLTYQPKQKTY